MPIAMIDSGTCYSAQRPTSQSQFTGKERDAETGLDYFGARYYSGAQGRFTSPDPFNILQEAEDRDELDGFLSNPQGWNKYVYSLNNPLAYVDPDGRNPVPAIMQLLQRLSPYADRAMQLTQQYGRQAYVAATNFFNSAMGQELTQTAIESVGGVPLGMSISPRSAIARQVNTALESAEAGARLEGQLGKQLINQIVDFRKTVTEGGRRVGEIDLETSSAIIEATLDATGKSGQVQKLLTNKTMNPLGKAVIVYGPNLKAGAIRDIQRVGGKVARTPKELEELLGQLE